MKKIKNEGELLKEAIRVGMRYFEARGAGKIDADDAIEIKIRAIYSLLVKDQVIQPLASKDENVQAMKHKLAIWIAKNLPADHHLLQ